MKFVWLRNELGKITCEFWPEDGLHCSAGRRTVLAEHKVETLLLSLDDLAIRFPATRD